MRLCPKTLNHCKDGEGEFFIGFCKFLLSLQWLYIIFIFTHTSKFIIALILDGEL